MAPEFCSFSSSILKLVPDGYKMEEMFTVQESQKQILYPNHIARKTVYSTYVSLGNRSNRVEVELSSPLLTQPIKGVERSGFHTFFARGVEAGLQRDLIRFHRDGLTTVRLRDFNGDARECLGIPRANGKIRSNNLTYPAYTPCAATPLFGVISWEVETIIKYFDDLPHNVLELILANLPTKDIFRYRSVCKSWYSTLYPSFWSFFRESSNRRPWFLLLDTLTSPKRKDSTSSTILPEAVYNMEVAALGDWCQIDIKITTPKTDKVDFVSSGGLICSMSGSNNFIVCNPCTGSSHQLPPLPDSDGGDNVKGMALHISPCSKHPGRLRFQVCVVIVQIDSTLRIKTYSSSLNSQERGAWTEKLQLNLADRLIYVWNPKRIIGVTTIGGEGQILLHFVTRDGSGSVCCDTRSGPIFMNPFPSTLHCCKVSELVVCDGTLYAVLILSGDARRPFPSRRLQVFEYNRDENKSNAMNKWIHVTTLPADLSTKCCINQRDHDRKISCAGYGYYLIVYVTCAPSTFTIQSNYALMFNLKEKAWVLLPSQPSGRTRIGHKMKICSLMPDIG